MKKIIRIIITLLFVFSVAGILSSCNVFKETKSHSQKLEPMKHKKPLPKKYIINNSYKPIVK